MSAGGSIVVKVGNWGLKRLVFVAELCEGLLIVEAETFVGMHKVGDLTLKTALSDVIYVYLLSQVLEHDLKFVVLISQQIVLILHQPGMWAMRIENQAFLA